MKTLSKMMLISACAFITFSCQKNKVEETTITIMELLPSDTIAFGTEFHVEGEIVGKHNLYGFQIDLVNQSTGVSVLKYGSDKKAKSYSFHEHWVNDVVDTTHFTFMVSANLDNNGNQVIKEVDAVCLPQ
jgi:hypothetical protein